MKKTTKVLLILLSLALLLNTLILPSFAMNFEFEEVSKSIFIVVSGEETGAISFGSGFAIDKHHVITNAHVVTNRDNIAIGSYSETAKDHIGDSYEAELVVIDEMLDIAVLYISDTRLPAIQVADANDIKEGDDVYAIGAPQGLTYTLTGGKVSSKLRDIDGIKYIQTDTPINPGNSGGPLLNNNGKVVGINTWKVADGENLGFAIHSDELVSYLADNGIRIKVVDGSADADPNAENQTIKIIAIVAAIVVLVGGAAVVVVVLIMKSKNSKEQTSDQPAEQPLSEDEKPTEMPAFTPIPAKPVGGLTVLSGTMAGVSIDLEDGQTINLGKDARFANLVFDTSYVSVSRAHCAITFDAQYEKYYVVDSSTNGTYANGVRLPKAARNPVARGTTLTLANDNCKIHLA